MRIIALSCAALASFAGSCQHSPWALEPVPASDRPPLIFFDSGAVVRIRLESGEVITGPLRTSFTPGAEQFLVSVSGLESRQVPLTALRQLKIPYRGTSIGADLGFRVGGVIALAHDDEDVEMAMLGMLGGAFVGGVVGSRITRWLTVAKRAELGQLVWATSGPELIPLTPAAYRFSTSCAREDSVTAPVVAVVRRSDGPFDTEIRQAWDLDTVVHRMIPTSTSRIRCRNESWSTRLAVARPELEASARTFTPSPGGARIYVHQRAAWMSDAPELEIALDRRSVGRTSPGTYLVLEVEPGAHEVGVIGDDKKTVVIEVASDSVYFVLVRAKRGIHGLGFGGIERVVDSARGRKMIEAAQPLRAVVDSTKP